MIQLNYVIKKIVLLAHALTASIACNYIDKKCKYLYFKILSVMFVSFLTHREENSL
jgi:hypothetical protein